MTKVNENTSEDVRVDLEEILRSMRGYLMAAKETKRGYTSIKTGKRRETDRTSDLIEKSYVPVESESLEAVRKESSDCRRCGLWSSRKTVVFGEGKPDAELLFVGEGPGEEEDRQGRPFVGRAGQLLTRIIAAMGLNREEVYIANIVKCRPPGNRNPKPEEMDACTPYLTRQIDAIRPRVICALGSVAARYFLKTETPVSILRGRFHDCGGIPVMVTYHPAYLLRNPGAKKQVWEDVQQISQFLAQGTR